MTGISGLLADYGIDTDDVEVPDFEIEDGIYYFVIGDVFIQHGTKADPDGGDSIVFSYRLSDEEEGLADGKEKREYFNLPEDPENLTEDESKKLGWYVSRVMSLGFERADVNSVDRDDLIGITGTMQLVHVAGKGKNKGKTFQNIRNVKAEEQDSPAPAPAPKVKAKSAPRAKSAPEPEEEVEEVEVVEEETTPKAKVGVKKTAPGNPFA